MGRGRDEAGSRERESNGIGAEERVKWVEASGGGQRAWGAGFITYYNPLAVPKTHPLRVMTPLPCFCHPAPFSTFLPPHLLLGVAPPPVSSPLCGNHRGTSDFVLCFYLTGLRIPFMITHQILGRFGIERRIPSANSHRVQRIARNLSFGQVSPMRWNIYRTKVV